MDNEGRVKPAGTQFDLNFESEVLVKIVSINKVRITFSHTDTIDEGDAFYITIMGAV